MHADVSPPPPSYLSIRDAAGKYRKAEITIRRFVRSVLEKEQAADRLLIHPAPKDAYTWKKKKRPFSYTIAEELLERHFGNATQQPPARRVTGKDDYRQLLESMNMSLQEQIKAKDEQLRLLAKAIDDLSERQRETNILMKGLQERLLLSAPKQDVVEASVSPPEKPVKAKRQFWGIWGS